MHNDYTKPIEMIDGVQVYFSIEKIGWHWCVYRHVKKPQYDAWVKYFHEWYFLKYFAEKRAKSMWNNYNRMDEKSRSGETIPIY